MIAITQAQLELLVRFDAEQCIKLVNVKVLASRSPRTGKASFKVSYGHAQIDTDDVTWVGPKPARFQDDKQSKMIGNEDRIDLH